MPGRKVRANLRSDGKNRVVQGLLVGTATCVLAAAGLSFAEYSFAVRKSQRETESLANYVARNPGSEQRLLKLRDLKSRKAQINVLPPGVTRRDDLGSVRVTMTQSFEARAFWPSGPIRTVATAAVLPSGPPVTGSLIVIVR